MEMLNSWWGGKPEKKTTEDTSQVQSEKNVDSGTDTVTSQNQGAAAAAPSPADTGGGEASTAASGGGEGNSGQQDGAGGVEAEAKSKSGDEDLGHDDKAVSDITAVVDGEGKAGAGKTEEKKQTMPLGGLTKEEAAEAAGAALNSAYNFGSFLFKKVSDTASKTANIIQKTVEEKTIVGEFTREQQKFVKEKHSKRSEAAVPPWVGYNEEEQMKEQILALSRDKRNFVRNPPAGVQFHFDYNSIHPIAMATLQEDSNLQKMRFELVPKKITEEHFWRNYFYRVSLIKQSSQLTSLAAKSGDGRKGSGSASHSSDEGSSLKGDKTPPIDVNGAPKVPAQRGKSEEEQLDMETPDSPPGSEFISDAFTSELDEADLKKGMEQLGMDKKDEEAAEEVPEWEKELQQELQEYEVVGEEQNEEWEREINQMLEDEVANES